MIRVLTQTRAARSRSRPASARRVAGDQRPRRLRLGHRGRRDHAALSRAADRRPAQSAGPHDDAQRPLRAPAAAGPAAWSTPARKNCRRSRRKARWRLRSFASKPGCRSGATRSEGFVLEKRLLLPYRQNTVHVTYRLLAGSGKLRLGLRPAIHFRAHDAPVSAANAAEVRRSRFATTSSKLRPAPELPMLRLQIHGPSAAFTFDRKGDRLDSLFRRSATAATNGRGRCGVPAISARTWARATRPR